MGVLTTVLELLGLLFLVAFAAILWWPAAIGVAGVALLWVAHGLSRRGTV